MLVDINLLPEKEKKNYSSFLVYTIMLALTIVVLGWGALMYWMNIEELERVENQIQQQNQMSAVLQSQLEGTEEEKQAKELQEIIDQLKENTGSGPIATIMDEVTQQVPATGSLDAFKLSEQQIDMTITTFSNEQAVDFFQRLKSLNIFNDVTIHTINYIESENHYVTSYTVHLHTDEEEGDE